MYILDQARTPNPGEDNVKGKLPSPLRDIYGFVDIFTVVDTSLSVVHLYNFPSPGKMVRPGHVNVPLGRSYQI